MEAFRYVDKKLYCEGVSIEKIAKGVGTPFYLYSHGKIEENYKVLDKMLKGIPHLICYACKANSNLKIFKILAELGSGADIVSGGELFKALKAGIHPKKIVFAGVGKTEGEIRYAIRSGIFMFNIESESELMLINSIAGRLGKKAPVAIRVNWGFDLHTHRYINTSKGSKFGIEAKDARKIYQRASRLKNIELLGIHSHLGSNIKAVEPFKKNLEMSISFTEDLKKIGINLHYMNLGGGIGISYKEGEPPAHIFKIGQALKKLIKGTDYRLIIEPGRFIIANAGILVTRVLYTKKSFGKNFVIVDAGMNDLIRPSLYSAYHRILPVDKSTSRQVNKVEVVGPVCETGDFLAQDRKMSIPKEGDLLAFMEVGAYGYEMSSNYNSRCRIPQILVQDKKYSVIREREKYTDLIRSEGL